MEGFFPSSQLQQRSLRSKTLLPKCGACGLFKKCDAPKMKPTGKGIKRILIIGEAPGEQEDKKNTQFIGPAGNLLNEYLHKAGINMRVDCWLTNALVCRPPKNRTPTEQEIGYCRPNIQRVLRKKKPHIIIPLGASAVRSLIGTLWPSDIGSISRWVGYQIPSQTLNAWICPTYHPSFVLRSQKGRGPFRKSSDPVLEREFQTHIKAAVALEDRPWDDVPDYKSRVTAILSPDTAIGHIKMFHQSRCISFDYETNMLKPDSPKAAIISCSISNGQLTIAFPWTPKVAAAMSLLLQSDVPKIAANLKFEDRWTRALLGHPVANWYWDTMQAAHWIDWRPGVTGLTFQAFVQLGMDPYDAHLKEYMRGKKGASVNQITTDIGLDDLLMYNGLDSLLEFKLGMKQMKQMNCPLPGE